MKEILKLLSALAGIGIPNLLSTNCYCKKNRSIGDVIDELFEEIIAKMPYAKTLSIHNGMPDIPVSIDELLQKHQNQLINSGEYTKNYLNRIDTAAEVCSQKFSGLKSYEILLSCKYPP